MIETRMMIEVWSDIMCPFCFLGKRRLASALARLPQANDVEVVWRSFQLNPSLQTDPSLSINDYLAREKGIDPRQAAAMNDRLTRLGADVGIVYNFDRAVVANTFDAHRLLHFARTLHRQDEVAERLFQAYFTEGNNIADHAVLAEVGRDEGLDIADVASMLASDRFAEDVRADIAEASELGIHGVPFFIFDGRYAISGAHETEVFERAIGQAYVDWQGSVST
jgi:predicted DsbA family dithiol-disulfide isomerase